MADACSMAGSSRLQMEAATMTPAANPVRIRCILSLMAFFMRNTQAAPKDVPKKGIKMPYNTWIFTGAS